MVCVSPEPLISFTSPERRPGAVGVKFTVTVHELPELKEPIQVVAPTVKSRPG
jgi:hypothetical protein